MKTLTYLLSILLLSVSIASSAFSKDTFISLSGIYPHLAFYNDEGECGTGAVVPFTDRLWVVT